MMVPLDFLSFVSLIISSVFISALIFTTCLKQPYRITLSLTLENFLRSPSCFANVSIVVVKLIVKNYHPSIAFLTQ